MSALRRWLPAALAGLWCAVAGAASPDPLADCAARAPPDARGIVALETACADLEAALQASGATDQLPANWREGLDAVGLDDLVTLRARYRGDPPASPADPAALPAILDQLASEQDAPRKSWWDVAKDWLRAWLGQPGQRSDSWLRDLLDRLSQSRDLIHVITYVLLAVVVAAAVAFIVNELRIAGVLSRRHAPRPRQGQTPDTAMPPRPLSLGDLDTAAWIDQPSILLRLLVAQLMARGALVTERSLTHRELIDRAVLPDADSRERFTRVARVAERAVYAQGTVDAEQARAAVADGRSLLQQWQAPPGKASA